MPGLISPTPEPAPRKTRTRRARQSQFERSTLTRAKLIEAAIRCLNRHGYCAVTVAMVAEEAGVSRGGLLHQFPTKVDLMLAVVEFASDYDERSSRGGAKPFADKRERFMALTDSTWQTITRPPAMAKLEIMIAARGDRVLAARLPAIVDKIEQNRRDNVFARARDIGITDRDAVDAMVCLHMAAMRGLAIERMFTKDKAVVERAFALLKTYKAGFVEAMLAPEGPAAPAPTKARREVEEKTSQRASRSD
jgi:AcrR family transcriptional regulator